MNKTVIKSVLINAINVIQSPLYSYLVAVKVGWVRTVEHVSL